MSEVPPRGWTWMRVAIELTIHQGLLNRLVSRLESAWQTILKVTSLAGGTNPSTLARKEAVSSSVPGDVGHELDPPRNFTCRCRPPP